MKRENGLRIEWRGGFKEREWIGESRHRGLRREERLDRKDRRVDRLRRERRG